jgi:hypothetical protein
MWSSHTHILKCGENVRIKSGPPEGIEGVLVRKSNSNRLVLSVDMLEKSVAVEVDELTVEAAPKRKRSTLTAAFGGVAGESYPFENARP